MPCICTLETRNHDPLCWIHSLQRYSLGGRLQGRNSPSCYWGALSVPPRVCQTQPAYRLPPTCARRVNEQRTDAEYDSELRTT